MVRYNITLPVDSSEVGRIELGKLGFTDIVYRWETHYRVPKLIVFDAIGNEEMLTMLVLSNSGTIIRYYL